MVHHYLGREADCAYDVPVEGAEVESFMSKNDPGRLEAAVFHCLVLETAMPGLKKKM